MFSKTLLTRFLQFKRTDKSLSVDAKVKPLLFCLFAFTLITQALAEDSRKHPGEDHTQALSYQYFIGMPFHQLHIAAPTAVQLSEEGAKGLFWDIIRAAFKHYDTQVESHHLNLGTAIKMLRRFRTVDIVLGAQIPLESTLATYYPLLETGLAVMHPENYSLRTIVDAKRVPVMLFAVPLRPKQLNHHKRIKLCNTLKQCYSHLKKRSSVALFFNPAKVRHKQHLKLSGFTMSPMIRPLLAFALFRDDAEGYALKQFLDLRLMELNQSGELARLYDKWQQGLPTLFLKRLPPNWL